MVQMITRSDAGRVGRPRADLAGGTGVGGAAEAERGPAGRTKPAASSEEVRALSADAGDQSRADPSGVLADRPRVAGRDPAGEFEHLYAECGAAVAKRMRSLVRPADRDQASDLAQEVWLRTWRAMAAGKELWSSPIGWLSTVSSHVAAEYYRRRSRRPAESAASPDSAVWADQKASAPSTSEISPELAAGLTALPRERAAAVLLREGYGLTGHQVAARLGCAKPTADRWAREALAALRESEQVQALASERPGRGGDAASGAPTRQETAVAIAHARAAVATRQAEAAAARATEAADDPAERGDGATGVGRDHDARVAAREAPVATRDVA